MALTGNAVLLLDDYLAKHDRNGTGATPTGATGSPGHSLG